MTYDLIILGAGAAGLMAAAQLKNRNILLIDHNARPGEKIRISGGGRCNLTNKYLSLEHYLGDSRFIEKVLAKFDNRDLLAWLKARGLAPVLRKESQYFCPHSAKEVIDLFLRETSHATFAYETEILSAEKVKSVFVVRTSKGTFRSKNLLVATGGLSYKSVGASGIGYEIAEGFGHTLTPLRPALVGLTLQPEQEWMKALSGLSLAVEATVGRRKLKGDLLFAHRGLSGPVILDASLYWNGGKITLDFLPGVRLKTLFKNPKKKASTQIPLPRRFVQAIFHAQQIPDMSYNRMDDAAKQRLSLMKSYAFAPAGTFGYAKAEVTKGGVRTDEIDPETMESLLIPGLFFAGEVVDVTGRLGGYNFQWAFSSAVTVSIAI